MYEIKKGVPIPSSSKGRVKYPHLHELSKKMEINDCVDVKDEYEAKALSNYIRYLRNPQADVGFQHGKAKYRITDSGATVWRVQ